MPTVAMGHSIRSKRKRAFRAIKRERYSLKERASLDKLLDESNIKKYVEEFQSKKEDAAKEVERTGDYPYLGLLNS